MGAYFVLDKRENNTKAVSFLMSDIMYAVYMPSLFERIEKDDKYYFKKKHIANFLKFTKILIDDEKILDLFLKNIACSYYSKNDIEDIKMCLNKVRNCFEDTLIDMVIEKKKKVVGYWE